MYINRLSEDFENFKHDAHFRHDDHRNLAALIKSMNPAKIDFISGCFSLLAKCDFKIKFLHNYRKTRHVAEDSPKGEELQEEIEKAEELQTKLVKFMKAITLRNRKIMVDLNLKLAVVAQTKKRDSILSYKLPSDFLEFNADQPDAVE